ncbi:transcriptional regulator GcvA [Rhizobium sp. 0TCS1.26]|uniref:transcriptional regulator GcvA n=1 Tax=Rhizobium sp. 0TCS1.26 TaxID=3142623 RepID=UPI003D2C06F6
MSRRLLPSLNALRTFEAVARHSSFTRAAEELNVTQSAASRLVRSLEEYLQIPLFTRQSRRIELTDEGRFYSRLVHEALDLVEAGTVELISSSKGKGTLSIGMLPTFGTRWLLPRLPSFQEKHPEIALNIISSDGELDFTKERIDVAIRFGHGNWQDAIVDPLMSEEIILVCNPNVMQGPNPLASYRSLRHHPLIRHSTRPNSWDHWFRSVGVQHDNMRWGPSFEHFFMIIQAVIAGLGVALLPTFLVEDEIRNGTLVAPFTARIAGPGAYYLVTSAAKAELNRVKLFRTWMLTQLPAAGS